MPFPIIEIVNRQRLDVFADGPNGANRLWIYTGTAVIDSNAQVWVVDNKLVHATADIVLGPSWIADPATGDNFNASPVSFIGGAVSVAPASLSDQGGSDNVTWATDASRLGLIVIDPVTKFLKISVDCSVQGEATALLRISYSAFVAVKDSTPDLLSLEFDPLRIIFDGITPWSVGKVTLSGPAPAGGAAVQLSTDRSDLLAMPLSVVVAPGALDASFKTFLSVRPRGAAVVNAEVAASFGKGRQTVTLMLLSGQ